MVIHDEKIERALSEVEEEPEDRLRERLITYELDRDDLRYEELSIDEGESVSTAELETTTIRPDSFTEVAEMLGAAPEDRRPPRDDEIPAFTPSAEQLAEAIEAEKPPAGSPDEKLHTVIDALLYTDPAHTPLALWQRELDLLVEEEILTPVFDLIAALRIEISDGGRFHVDPSTNLVFASTIEINGSGELTYDGRTHVDCFQTVGVP